MNNASSQEIQGSSLPVEDYIERTFTKWCDQRDALTSESGSSDEGAAVEWLTDPNTWSISQNLPDTDYKFIWDNRWELYDDQEVQQGLP